MTKSLVKVNSHFLNKHHNNNNNLKLLIIKINKKVKKINNNINQEILCFISKE